MSNILKSKSAKLVLGLVAFAFAFTSANVASAYTFTAPTLKTGSRSSQVMELQKALNMCADTMIATGAGSTGYETTYFGAKTAAVVKIWQAKMGLTADALFGPASRAKMNTNGCGTTTGGTLPAGCTSTSGFSPITGQACNGGTTIPQNGPVTAMLSNDNPATGTLVAGQATADLAHFTFSGTGTVTNVTLQRIGVSTDATLSNMYLFDGATRLTEAGTVSNGMVSFNVPAGLFSVSGAKSIKVKSDILDGISGQTVGVKLVSFATAAGTTTAGISGNLHNVSDVDLATVSISGTVTPASGIINPGANITLWQANLSIGTRDVKMARFALRNIGSAPASAFQNFKLYVNGVQVATAAGMDSLGSVTFDLSSAPTTLVTGSRLVRVDADVVSGASRTARFGLRVAADADFIDSGLNVNVTPASITSWTPTGAVTISGTNGGSVTVERDTSSPSGNVILNGSNVKIGSFKVTAYGESVKIETLKVGGTTSSAATTLRNGRLMINGVQHGSTTNLAVDSTGTTFTTNYTIMPGTPVIVDVHADIYAGSGSAVVATDSFTVKILGSSSLDNGVLMDSQNRYDVPGADVSANPVTVSAAALTLAKNGTYANQSVSLPASSFKIGSWNLSGSSVEDVTVTGLSFDITEVSSTTFNEDDITNMYVVLKNGATTVATSSPLATVSATSNSFSVNYLLTKNSNLVIELYGNLGSTVTSTDSFKSELIVTGNSMTSGNTVTTPSSGNVDGQTIAQGTASISATAQTSPVKGIVRDNQTVEVANFKFDAVTAAYGITDITFTLPTGDVAESIMLYDGATLIDTRAAGTTSVTFSGINTDGNGNVLGWMVPANASKVLTVKLQLGEITTNITSGSALTTTLTAFTARNTSTGISATGTESDPAGQAMYAFAAIPVVTAQSSTTALTNGSSKPLLKFKIDAEGGTIAWHQFFFDVTKDTATKIASTTTTGVTLYDVTNGGNTVVDGTFTNTSIAAAGSTSGSILFVPTSEQQITSSKTYELRGTVSGATTDSNVSIIMANDSTAFVTMNDVAALQLADADAPIIWSDLSIASHTSATNDWTTDFGVRSLPVDNTLSY
ncbi:peptidoglycan-binding protein [Candidatus Woesebacteria bacterium]|nr:peptidoglycan-binding protein [Candidatus Woesebacteria bacterium]